MNKITAALAAGAIGLLSTSVMAAGALTGAGGTAIYPLLAKWAQTYEQKTGTAVNYQAIGSGGGIKQIEAKTVQFANSDMPLKPADLAKNGLIQFPQVIISITPVMNVAGLKPGSLTLDGKTLADIYLGKVTSWDDPAIKALNPKLHLPHLAIAIVHRSDASGTTFNFTDYLSKVSPDWQSSVGEGTSVSWPGGVGGKGNAGVASYVQQTKGAIGYVEYAYAIQNHLVYVDMINAEGRKVAPTMSAFQAAAANADFTKTQNFYLILTNQPGAKSWPITAATYMLMRKDAPPADNLAVLNFLDWALRKGQAAAKKLDYVPIPDSVVGQIEASWAQDLKAADGSPLWKAATN
jgi:phosphate transport system substrate-binding protein